MAIQTINPATGKHVKSFDTLSSEDIDRKIGAAQETFREWRERPLGERTKRLTQASKILTKRTPEFAKLVTLEMGKPIGEATAEIEKCAAACAMFAKRADEYLAPIPIKSEASRSYVRFDPLGVVLAVMPWNFPFWQVIRFAAPGLTAGNVGLLKHASNVPQCALALEEVFAEAGYPEHAFSALLIESSAVQAIVEDERVAAVTLTGSEPAGSSVAETAGKHIKKSVLELGGSDPFIVLDDADIKTAAAEGAHARTLNSGQSCIAAKRFIVVKSVVDEFTKQFVKAIESLTVGDPTKPDTKVGPLSRPDQVDALDKQVRASVKSGAKVLTGGQPKDGPGAYYEPTVLGNVQPGMPAYDEELFGPVASLITVDDEDDAIRVANDTRYGLGASVWTKDAKRGEQIAERIESGSVFINQMVRSHPELPFGGVKKSGYGRELDGFGIREFTNVKTVLVH
jgi:succinate-semialdehyde dehydrogenase / glutarate-semialdehyde dehydrogenase